MCWARAQVLVRVRWAYSAAHCTGASGRCQFTSTARASAPDAQGGIYYARKPVLSPSSPQWGAETSLRAADSDKMALHKPPKSMGARKGTRPQRQSSTGDTGKPGRPGTRPELGCVADTEGTKCIAASGQAVEKQVLHGFPPVRPLTVKPERWWVCAQCFLSVLGRDQNPVFSLGGAAAIAEAWPCSAENCCPGLCFLA